MKTKIHNLADYPNFTRWAEENCRATCQTWEDVLIHAGYTSCTWPYNDNNDSCYDIEMSEEEYIHFILRWS